jgi:type I restriction enzyme S subunit
MGVRKVEGIAPMQEGLAASDISRYKIVRNNWFAYNPMRLNIGSIARWHGDSDILVSPDYVVFRCLEESDRRALSADYLDHFRHSGQWDAFVAEAGDGGVRVRIYYDDISQLQLSLPDIAEQQKIADCLGSLDDLIAAESRKLEALRQHKQGLMQQLFPREGEAHPRRRFPEFRDALHWDSTRVGRVCDLKAGDFVPASMIAEKHRKGLYPCYGANGLRGYVTSHTHDGRYVLVGRQGALCGNVMLCAGRFHATEHALVATPSTDVDVEWLLYALDALSLNRFASGQAQPGLSVRVLNEVAISVPTDLIEQQCIAGCLSTLDARIVAQSRRLDLINRHKQGLLQQLFPNVEEESR